METKCDACGIYCGDNHICSRTTTLGKVKLCGSCYGRLHRGLILHPKVSAYGKCLIWYLDGDTVYGGHIGVNTLNEYVDVLCTDDAKAAMEFLRPKLVGRFIAKPVTFRED